ncbi:MAG: hypothetical protein QNK05_22680 [Myxococcota bacterium]|nr:hypothetical protein [Myxococcota bacterium]
MATRLPDPLNRRHLLEKDLPEAKALAVAEGYLAEGRLVESLAFLSKAGATEKLRELRDQAVQEGDVFLLRETSLALEVGIDGETWKRTAQAAEAKGLALYAEEARRQSEAAGA